MTNEADPLANATLAEMEAFAAALLPTYALDYYGVGRSRRADVPGQPGRVGSLVAAAADAQRRVDGLARDDGPRPSDRAADHGRADGLAAAGAPRRRAGDGEGGDRRRHDHGRLDEHHGPDRGDRRGPRRRLLVPALPVPRLRGNGGHDRSRGRRRGEGDLPDRRRGQPHRPEAQAPRRSGHAGLGQVPDAPAACRGHARRARLALPRAAARAGQRPDRPQGHPPPGRRPGRGRCRDPGDRRQQPRRTDPRWRGHDGRDPARDRRCGRRSDRAARRRRDPPRRRRHPRPGPRRAGRPRRAAVPVGPRDRRPGGPGAGLRDAPRRARAGRPALRPRRRHDGDRATSSGSAASGL